MENQTRHELEAALGNALSRPPVPLPSGIGYSRAGNTVTLTLPGRAVGLGIGRPYNMQADPAAFEAWALALHVHLDLSVRLALAEMPSGEPEQSGHYHRFLYRVHRFAEQFPWFTCEPSLQALADDEAETLYHDGAIFYSNYPTGAASESGKRENELEAYFGDGAAGSAELARLAAEEGERLEPSRIYRQLPTGLFKTEKIREQDSEFTGGRSAIDLWAPSGDSIALFELKADNISLKAGIVSELMFYANYVYDMYVDKAISGCTAFRPSRPKELCRGYGELLDAKPRSVHAYMLTDKYLDKPSDKPDAKPIHPLINSAVTAELNRNTRAIRYGALTFPPGLAVR